MYLIIFLQKDKKMQVVQNNISIISLNQENYQVRVTVLPEEHNKKNTRVTIRVYFGVNL